MVYPINKKPLFLIWNHISNSDILLEDANLTMIVFRDFDRIELFGLKWVIVFAFSWFTTIKLRIKQQNWYSRTEGAFRTTSTFVAWYPSCHVKFRLYSEFTCKYKKHTSSITTLIVKRKNIYIFIIWTISLLGSCQQLH